MVLPKPSAMAPDAQLVAEDRRITPLPADKQSEERWKTEKSHHPQMRIMILLALWKPNKVDCEMWSIADVKFRRYINNLELAVLMSCSTNTDELLTLDWHVTNHGSRHMMTSTRKSIRTNIHSEHLAHWRNKNPEIYFPCYYPNPYICHVESIRSKKGTEPCDKCWSKLLRNTRLSTSQWLPWVEKILQQLDKTSSLW